MDRNIPGTRPSQQNILVTLVVALYESFFSFLALSGINVRLESSRYADMNINYCNSPVEQIQDIYIPAAKSFLTSYSF
jgi:hypothetical protein